MARAGGRANVLETSPQGVLNSSIDTDFEILSVEPVIFDGTNLVRIRGTAAGYQYVSAVTTEQEVAPDAAYKNNAVTTLGYDASDQLINISAVMGGSTYIKNFTWTAGNLTGISEWH